MSDSDLVFLNGKAVENPHENHHHVSSVGTYLAVFVGLLVLTVVTYAVSFADLGAGALPVAMFVATIKASLVIAYFMHLKYEDRFYAFLFTVCLLFVGIFFFVVLNDIDFSSALNPETGMQYKKSVEDAAEQVLNR